MNARELLQEVLQLTDIFIWTVPYGQLETKHNKKECPLSFISARFNPVKLYKSCLREEVMIYYRDV